jgi:hypothetical protein
MMGVIGIAFSVVMLIKANFGLSSFNALLASLSEATGITMGVFGWISGFVFIVFNMVVSKKKFNWSALIISFLIGSLIDFFYVFLAGAISYESLSIRLAVFVAMLMMTGTSISLLIYSGVISPLEEYQFAIQKLFKTSVATAKFYSDMSFFIFAIVVSMLNHNGLGQINVGTVVITLATGRIIGIVLDALNGMTQQRVNA